MDSNTQLLKKVDYIEIQQSRQYNNFW